MYWRRVKNVPWWEWALRVIGASIPLAFSVWVVISLIRIDLGWFLPFMWPAFILSVAFSLGIILWDGS